MRASGLLTTAALVAVLNVLVPFSSARAQATVTIQVRGTDGHVTLTSTAGGVGYSCTTTSNRCTISGVAGGHYSVVLSTSGRQTQPRRVFIPPSGTVQLHVSSD